MHLTLRTDYAFRVLIHLARHGHTQNRMTIRHIAERHNISHNHLMKVVNDLCHHGLLVGTRGRNGGVSLARSPKDINVGHVIRLMETEGEVMTGCAPLQGSPCILADACRLRHLTRQATDAFMAILDGMSVHDLLS
ncbi:MULTISPECIES: RrF2 family transcriptional regulator [Komagataeibacter]|uniref:Rrf2 family transcriptional regulator n=1 Tax=Komagataeibacter swingsii TaxID=215220 RepID=A0A2V4RIM1_9PROT|nr:MULTISPECIES: Rrf2 family transcriptional regulator [Komagataeibacter]PYD68804.1 Rrf2 family transcriptional regulator [Komagataeibacter swingsii]GBQ66172.1 Rrf2 family transcriptional regulator [Komagataeibacter swingsii DSM 16373]GCE90888.1 Rrf2 family transcriptional regulator [Komagataeibacter diospyri]